MTIRRWASKTRGQTTRLAMPNSSSKVTKTTPEAVPGRWRTSTSPAICRKSPLRVSRSFFESAMRRSHRVGRSSCSGWARNDIEMVE